MQENSSMVPSFTCIYLNTSLHIFGAEFILVITDKRTGPVIFISLLELKPQPCDSQPCKNDGTCRNVGDSFSCVCVGNFQGITCAGTYKNIKQTECVLNNALG